MFQSFLYGVCCFSCLEGPGCSPWSVLVQNRGVDIYKRDGFGLNISANMSWLLFPSAWHQQGLKALSTTPQFLLLWSGRECGSVIRKYLLHFSMFLVFSLLIRLNNSSLLVGDPYMRPFGPHVEKQTAKQWTIFHICLRISSVLWRRTEQNLLLNLPKWLSMTRWEFFNFKEVLEKRLSQGDSWHNCH